MGVVVCAVQAELIDPMSEDSRVLPVTEVGRIVYVESTNTSSMRLCEKLGMRREGVFVEFISFTTDDAGNPIYENTMQYAILRHEWMSGAAAIR